MRVTRVMSSALVAVCLVFPTAGHALAGDANSSTPKVRKKTHRQPAPAAPSGVRRSPDPTDAYYGGTRVDTVKEFTNELGQTVYSVAASHFDVSPTLLDMVAAAPREQAAGEGEEEAPSNPMLPEWRIIRSGVPDPVVQPVVAPDDFQRFSGVPSAAPAIGFSFDGVPINGGTPSDCNGSVGNNQFVETVNTRYQVWSLNRATHTATPLLPNTTTPSPQPINTLWSGFGGACEVQNSGDPIVVYDKTANRWLISQFTSTPSGGVYYQCVAVSTTSNATGTYNRWAFAVPGGKFGDYPHIAVWSDAYYMMAHGFGAQYAALFAAMDRAKMIQGIAAATWIVFQDPAEGGHMPADLDGFAQPPTKAPGIFVSIHPEGMYIYRMKVNFASPGSTTKTLQAIVPVAPANAACGGGTCIPQPGAGALDSLADRLMFRAAYRNFIDHESLVVTHSVDPAVPGVASGVRWYDFRISGTPNATCPTYPCIYQQGTIADVDNGRSRWMSSIAMDSSENVLVGYSTSGKTAGTENHSSRFTGRAKADPPGTMTVPETTIITGTANNASNSRWGDYSSMSSDPADDCTFWYVSQYFTITNQWSTRIASAIFPTGSGAGQCLASTCTTRPPTVPLIGTATTPADNQIAITWGPMTPTPGAYAIERAEGACGASEGLYRPLTSVPGATTNYLDTTVAAGVTYSYRVRGTTDAAAKCQSLITSGCTSATATGNCVVQPSFAGAASATSTGAGNCGVTVNWAAGASGCALAPNLRYNVFRGTVPDFVPGAANRIATCVIGPSSYVDTDNLQSGTTYYYVVRAEDTSTGNGGECGGGNEEANTVRVSATPYATGTQSTPGTWTDGGGDGSQLLTSSITVTSGQPGWRIVKTTDDPGANHTPAGGYAYRNAGPAAGATYAPSTCAQLQAPPLTAAATTVNLKYWERHQVEYHWDAIAVEYSVNGGPFTDVPAPSNSAGDGCDPADDTTGWEALSCTGASPANACGFPDTKNVFSGPLGGGSTCTDFATSAEVTPYAHRCHQITGLSPDDSIRFRWQFSSDELSDFAGFYLDDVAVTNVKLQNACSPNTCPGQPDGTACSDGNACTTGDTCSGGACSAGPVSGPADTSNLAADPDKSTYSWSAVPTATRYDAVRGSLSALPVGPGAGDEVCFDDLASPSLVDATVPAPDTGFWYLSRGENACGNGSFGQRSNGSPRVTTTCP